MFEPAEILRVLEAHDVAYVVIGGLAAVLHGGPHLTNDIDITPSTAESNLDRLSRALDEIGAKVWTQDSPEGLAFDHDGASLGAVQVWNLITRFGRMDISFVPSGTRGYEDLRADAVRIDVLGVDAPIASLADVVRSKEAAGRVKDRLMVPVLRRMIAETEERRNDR